MGTGEEETRDEAGSGCTPPVRSQRNEEGAVVVMRSSTEVGGKPETRDVLEATSGKLRTVNGPLAFAAWRPPVEGEEEKK